MLVVSSAEIKGYLGQNCRKAKARLWRRLMREAVTARDRADYATVDNRALRRVYPAQRGSAAQKKKAGFEDLAHC